MTLAIDFTESFQLGSSTGATFDTVSVQLTVGTGYGATVGSFDITSLNFDPTAATYFEVVAGPGFLISTNPGSGTLDFAGIVTGAEVAPGASLATIVFHLTSGATGVVLTNIAGDLNFDPLSSHADVPCFAAGTLIRTRHGDVPVETLLEGDEVMTLLGGRWPCLALQLQFQFKM